MAAKLAELLKDVDWDLIDLGGMKEVLRNIANIVQQELTTTEGKQTGQFHDKHIGKPDPWDGEKEEDFKAWNEKFTTFMANAGEKKWRRILKAIQARGDAEDLEENEKVEELVKSAEDLRSLGPPSDWPQLLKN